MEKKYRYMISAEGKEAILAQQINSALQDIDERVNELEHKSSRIGKKPEVSRAEKMLLLMKLGVIEHLFSLEISQKTIAKLLTIIINASFSNIESDLSDRHNAKPIIKTKKNYQFLVDTFRELNLNELADRCQHELDAIEED